MNDLGSLSKAVAELMDEFNLSEAEYAKPGLVVGFKKNLPKVVAAAPVGEVAYAEEDQTAEEAYEAPVQEAGPVGIPVSSPMTGIYYSAPSPNAAPFVKEGDTVAAGQVVCLIEAMKVFNEITSPKAGRVEKIVAKNGSVVNPGEPIMFIN